MNNYHNEIKKTEDKVSEYKVQITNGSNKISFKIKNTNEENNLNKKSKFISNIIISELKNLYDANENLKNLGYKGNYFGFTINRDCILNIFSNNEIFIKNIKFSFKKILDIEKNGQGLGLEYLSKLISKSLSNHNNDSEEIPNQEIFTKLNPYQEDIKAVLENNYANGKIIKTLYFKNQILESLFTDFQAFHICKGLKNQSYLHNKYQNNKQTEEDTFLAHSLANTLLKEKGKKMVDFVLSLPSLPFKSEQFQILFSKLDKIRLEGKNENPIIRLKIPNEKGTEDEIEFSFYAIDGKKYINQIITKTKKSEVFSVTRNGTILPNENNLSNGKNLNITPILQLFYHISKSNENFNQAVISYGIESGKCSVCGRKLNDEKSKLKGIGPVCDKIL